MIWCLVVTVGFAGLLVGVGLGRWMEWEELKYRLGKRIRKRRHRKLMKRWRDTEAVRRTTNRAIRNPRRTPPEV